MSDQVPCPFCGSTEIEQVAAWGGQIITQQCRCRGCNSYFEAIRDDFAATDASAGQGAGGPGP